LTVPEAIVAMSDPASAQWQRRRAEFSHDWLRNRFLPRLHARLALARAGVHAHPLTMKSLEEGIREWPERGAEALQLADTFDIIMSPLRWIENLAPLLGSDVASFVRCATDEAWRTRHQVDSIVREIRTRHSEADRCYQEWVRRPSSSTALRDMARHCERLAQALSKLPSRIIL
jgi:hypothetical protein